MSGKDIFIIDWEQAKKLAGNNLDFAKEILDLFIKTLPGAISEIKQAYTDQNFPALLHHIHKLHGATCYCGLPRLKAVLFNLETDLKSNIMDSSSLLLEQLEHEANLLLEHYSHQPI